MTKKPMLLKGKNVQSIFRIKLRLQEGRTAQFEYSDRQMAREHYDFLQATGVVGGFAIREINFTEDEVRA